jgi:hypothetical protein
LKSVFIIALVGVIAFSTIAFILSVSNMDNSTTYSESIVEQEKVIPANHELCSVWNDDCEGNEYKSSIGLISTYVRDKIIPDEVIDVELVNDRYYGLTENQIMHVKMIEESCDTKTFEVELFSGKTASELYAQKCDEAVLNKIEGYR